MRSLKTWIKQVYQTPVCLTGKDYEEGQSLFILECVCGTSLTRLTQGAFIAGFAKMLGMSEGMIGIISAIPMFANIFQLLGGICFRNSTQYKSIVSFGSLIARSLIGTIYFIPLLVIKNTYQAMLFVMIYCIAYFLFAFLSPPITSWIMDLAPECIRGRYFAKREMVTMIVVAIGELVIAQMLDTFKVRNIEQIGFILLGVVVVTWAILNFYCFSKIKEPIRSDKKIKQSIKKELSLLVQDINFRKIANLYVIWNFALYIGILYIAIYMINVLKLSYLYTMMMSMLTLAFRVLSVRLWGKFVETHLWSKAIEIGAILLGLATALLFFANGVTALFILPIFHILSGIAWGSIGITFFNLQVMFAPEEARTLYIGALASLSGVAGFIATVASGFFIDRFSNVHILILGFTIGNIQLIFLVSGILLVFSGLYVRKIIAPMEREKKTIPIDYIR